jgi:adenylylsulfate kinase-like enzyme
LETCEARDPKDLYKKARAGEIENFTGVNAPYEAPQAAEITLDSDAKGIDELADEVVTYLSKRGLLTLSD